MIPFRDFMEAALYDPERGFYARRTPAEDFYTAPELHSAFGGALARSLAQRLDELRAASVPGPYTLVEMGSGSGLLARQVLQTLKRERPDLAQETMYILIERTREMLLHSMVTLTGTAERLMGYARLADIEPCRGVFFSNELIDAFPVHVLEKRDGQVQELYVDDQGRESVGPLSTAALKPHADAVAPGLSEGQRHAVNLEMDAWLAEVCGKLQEGFLLTIDYGRRLAAGQPNEPRTYYKHSTDNGIVGQPGRKDITANVDFERLMVAGKALGLEMLSYGSLSHFLLDQRIEDWLPRGQDVSSYKERAKVKTLFHPDGMGETFKVMLQRKRTPAC